MGSTLRLVKARKQHRCDDRMGGPTLCRGLIAPGEVYTRITLFPDDLLNISDAPVAIRSCAACTARRAAIQAEREVSHG